MGRICEGVIRRDFDCSLAGPSQGGTSRTREEAARVWVPSGAVPGTVILGEGLVGGSGAGSAAKIGTAAPLPRVVGTSGGASTTREGDRGARGGGGETGRMPCEVGTSSSSSASSFRTSSGKSLRTFWERR